MAQTKHIKKTRTASRTLMKTIAGVAGLAALGYTGLYVTRKLVKPKPVDKVAVARARWKLARAEYIAAGRRGAPQHITNKLWGQRMAAYEHFGDAVRNSR